MRRSEALELLEIHRETLRKQFGVKRIGLFGSVARDEATPLSDLDVVVEMAPDISALVRVKEFLEEVFHSPVDIVRYRSRMNPFLKQRIDQEAKYV